VLITRVSTYVTSLVVSQRRRLAYLARRRPFTVLQCLSHFRSGTHWSLRLTRNGTAWHHCNTCRPGNINL